MPTYQYACTACDHAFEQFQNFTDDALTVCPACTGKLRKVFNAVGVVFKGSGFYRTDSRADAKSGADTSAAAGAKSDTGSSTTSESSSSDGGSTTTKTKAKTETKKSETPAA